MKNPSPLVRTATLKDANFIHACVCDLEEIDFPFPVFQEILAGNLFIKENIYLVVEEEDGTCSGYLSCHSQMLLHHLGRVFEIQEMFVIHEFRNKGRGRLLIQGLDQALKAFDYQSLEVTANRKRENTHSFYKSIGFEYTHLKFTKPHPALNKETWI